jgi:sulfite exporter TauE/SafE
MAQEASYLAAFLVGLMGGVHCVGMCGGIVGALTLGLPESVRNRVGAMMPYLIAYNVGRITSYAIAGALMGGVGLIAANAAALREAQLVLQVVAGLFMVALGLYLGGWWQGLAQLERAGGVLWRRIEPFGRRLMPVKTPWQALGLGLIWGWLPCGLVYSVLVWAIAAGGMVEGALLMASFGLGTLPMLLGMGVFAATLATQVRRPLWRGLAGGLVVVFGVYTVGVAFMAPPAGAG